MSWPLEWRNLKGVYRAHRTHCLPWRKLVGLFLWMRSRDRGNNASEQSGQQHQNRYSLSFHGPLLKSANCVPGPAILSFAANSAEPGRRVDRLLDQSVEFSSSVSRSVVMALLRVKE